jgi:DNA-binding MarR family transcriptional regulator
MHGNGSQVDNGKLAEMARTCACFNFRKASRSVTQLFDQTLSPAGLRSTQLVILISGQLLGPTSIARLARELVMDRSTLTRNLKPLLALGLLRLTRPAKGKQKAVEVTDEGREALMKSAPYWEHAQTQLAGRFGAEHWNRIMSDLAAIVEAARSSAPQTPGAD